MWGCWSGEEQAPCWEVKSWAPTVQSVNCEEQWWIAKGRWTRSCCSRLFWLTFQYCYYSDSGHCRLPLSPADTVVPARLLWMKSAGFPSNNLD